MSPRKPTLDDLVKEARDERVPELDWARMEEPLFARIADEARSRAALEQYEGKRRTWVAGGMLLAVAASIPLFWMATRDVTLDASSQVRAPSAGDLSWKEPNAIVHVTRAGVAHDATAGESMAQGDLIEPTRGRVVFARANPGAVTWDAEDNAKVEVTATQGTLILALERGAVEAQVAPVANGEAFAIDIDGTRVAVHGTHLRVARDGSHTTVDLREGVVSIGAPPRSGSTYGDLVTAPAHVEFDAGDPHGTLKVTHELTRVRAAASFDAPHEAPVREAREARMGTASAVPTPAPRAATAAMAPPATPRAPSVSPPPAVAAAPAIVPAAAPVSPASSPASVAAPVPAVPTPVQVDPNPQRTIANAVRACESTHVAQTTGVVVTVSSTLELRVTDTGMVDSARFNPPLAPDIQQCAVRVIYGTRFARAGLVSVPIDFTR